MQAKLSKRSVANLRFAAARSQSDPVICRPCRPHRSKAFVRKGFVRSWLQIYDLQPFDLQGCARGRFCKGLLSEAEQAANQGIGFVSGGFVSVARNRLGP